MNNACFMLDCPSLEKIDALGKDEDGYCFHVSFGLIGTKLVCFRLYGITFPFNKCSTTVN